MLYVIIKRYLFYKTAGFISYDKVLKYGGVIMLPIIHAYPVYKFMFWAEQNILEKNVLDCGAGGNKPPLILFKKSGYQTTGIDISSKAIKKANDYSREHNIELNIGWGDMRELEFEDSSFSLVYSYNSIFHMEKEEIKKSIDEMLRVLKKKGMLFVNLLSVEDQLFGQGEKIGVGEFLQEEGDAHVVHSFFEEEEADKLFKKYKLIHREKRNIDLSYKGKQIHQVYLDYIIKKST